MDNRPYKTVSKSAVDYYPYPIFPNDLNTKHTIFGGVILAQADKLAADVAQRHSGQICVTARVDSVIFISPAREGEKLIFNFHHYPIR